MLNQLEQSGIVTKIEIDENDDIVLPFPSEILEAVGWQEGDLLNIDIFAGRIIIQKIPEGSGDGVGTPESEQGQMF